MKRKNPGNTAQVHISPVKMLGLILVFSAFFQLVIITYTHFSGIFINHSLIQFFFRWGYSTLLTMVGFSLIMYPDLYLIHYLNRQFPWNSRLIQRMFIQLIFTIVTASLVATLITVTAHLLNPYPDGLAGNIINNILITIVVNILLMSTMEAWIFFREGRISRKKAEDLEREITSIRFEVLKNQINPHFLFNSLNVLSGLVTRDAERAQQFIDEFSMIYRYVLETIEQQVVTLKEEIEFARSYMFLQQIRYGDSLSFSIKLESEWLQCLMPPLSLQVVLENAIKHNVINEAQPLHIQIYRNDRWLIIKNNIQRKISAESTTGIGQKNLKKRFDLFTPINPIFEIDNSSYIAKLPLITNEDSNY